jgi:hypothetical protein
MTTVIQVTEYYGHYLILLKGNQIGILLSSVQNAKRI